MILNVYAYYNKMLNAFSNAQYDDHSPENVCIYIQRDIKQAFLKGDYEKIRYLDFYKLGTFNDETGEFINDKQLLLNLDTVIAGLEAANLVAKITEETAKESAGA